MAAGAASEAAAAAGGAGLAAVRAAVGPVRRAVAASPLAKQGVEYSGVQCTTSVFAGVDAAARAAVREAAAASGSVPLARARGALVSLAVADGLGHNFEFLPVVDEPDPDMHFFEYPSPPDAEDSGGVFYNVLNKFQLAPGQWTDDCSMALCMADSLLTKGRYDGTDIRVWFWNWWNNGVVNAFVRDTARIRHFARWGGSLSVGLGGNISKSLGQIDKLARRGQPIPPRFEADTEDAGNGSLMRLAPIPLWSHGDIARARELAYESSLTTHPGPLAAEACAFMAHVIVRAIHRPDADPRTARQFLDDTVAEYVTTVLDPAPDGTTGAKATLRRLLAAAEPDTSTERCWNWRNALGDLGMVRTIKNRGRTYNGYPVSAGYFGAFSFDGLALSLHCLYNTTSLNQCIVRVVNHLGDADTTGAIAAQMAGAFYGIGELEPQWVRDLEVWDAGEIDLRAIALFVAGENGDSGQAAGGAGADGAGADGAGADGAGADGAGADGAAAAATAAATAAAAPAADTTDAAAPADGADK